MVSGWSVFFGLLALYILVLAAVSRRTHEDAALKLAGPLILWRTKRGRRLLERVASPRRFWRTWGDASILATVTAGLLTLALLVFQLVILFQQPEQATQNAPEPVLLLGIPGVNPLIPIWYGIFALLLALVVHEGSHGILSRATDIDVKSLGLLLFIVPIGAFVEPDEEDMRRASARDRNRVYSAGPMSNLVVGAVAAVVFSGVFMAGLTVSAGGAGLGVAGVVDGSPADEVGIEPGDVIEEVGNRSVATSTAFSEALSAPQSVPGARGQAYAFDGHEDALRTPANRSLDPGLPGDAAAGLWVDPDGAEADPLVTLGPAGDGARPDCASFRLAVVPGDGGGGPVVRLDAGPDRHEARFPGASWPGNWTQVAADATGDGVALMLDGTWREAEAAGANPDACQEAPEGLQAWVGAGPDGFLDGAVDEVRLHEGNVSRVEILSTLDKPYQDEGAPTRNASHEPRLVGGEALVLQMDGDDVNAPGVGRTRDASGGDRHATLVGPRAGDTVSVTLVRDGATRTVSATLTDKGEYYEETAPDANRESYRGAGFLGVSVVPLEQVSFFRSVLAQPLDHGVGGVFFYISYPFLVFTQQLDILNAPLNGFFDVGGPAAGLGGGFWVAANTLYWVFWINLMLGTFNALPAGPLDGGQMLRETLKDRLLGWYGVEEEDLEYEETEEGKGVDVRGRDPGTQRKVEKVNALVSRTMWTVGLSILGLIMLPVVAPQLAPLIP